MLRRKSLRLTGFLMLVLMVLTNCVMAQRWNPSHSVGPTTGKYAYQYGQTPDQLVEIYPALIPAGSVSYEWQISFTANEDNFTAVSGGNQSSYTPVPVTRTTYCRRKSTNASGEFIYSNVVKLIVVSANWVDKNYIKEYNVQVKGVSTAQGVGQLPIGDKLETTNYVDGLGREVQSVYHGIATPAQPGGLWGDVVKFNKYNELGLEVQNFLPYTTTTELGKYKTTAATEQEQFYINRYNETFPYSQTNYEKSPLGRPVNQKEAGSKWAIGNGTDIEYGVNSADENVRWMKPENRYDNYGKKPRDMGAYAPNTLIKRSYIDKTDGQWRKVIEYYTKGGELILKKVQLDDAPSIAYAGWVCTYSVYDLWGNLRFQLEPEAVKYLDEHGWSFDGAEVDQMLNGLCYRYDYDFHNRNIFKKAPGAEPLKMVYDIRDRLVYTQDGNQAAVLPIPQWTAYVYDELDRPVLTTLYHTSKTAEVLQAEQNAAKTITRIPIPGQLAGKYLDIRERDPAITRYVASKGMIIGLGGNFVCPLGQSFVAEIDEHAALYTELDIKTTITSPVTNAELNDPSITTVLKYLYYDDYSFASAQPFNNGFTNTTVYSTSDPNVMPIVTTNRTLSLSTGSRIRVLGSNTFLSTTNYYNEDEQVIQILKDNIKAGIDITTWQYHWGGRLLSSCSNHTTSGTGYSNFITLTKNNFDKLGRVTSVDKQFGSNGIKTVATYTYDDMGRLKTKHLDPGYTAGGNSELESLDYSYNLHGQLIGINKDYALKNPSNYNKWSHFFGMYLGYDNRDNAFTRTRLDGRVSGVLWNTQGDDAQRKYDYTYDNSGRLTSADFTEQKQPGVGWSNSKMDFSVTGTGGKMTYDLNGNLLNMLQKGVVPGNAAPVVIDDLAYTYEIYSNKLKSVTDNTPLSASLNGRSGDFKDGANGSGSDYVYDKNGNLVIDLNKNAKELENIVGANGVSYNYLDKPEKIRIAGKGTVRIVYNANGEKLQRAFIPESGDPATVTTYIKQFVYQQTGAVTASTAPPFLQTGGSLSFINFEEGRLRVVDPITLNNRLDALLIIGNINLPNGKMGVYDYFIYDYLHNVRMVLTEETHIALNTCTMESGRTNEEVPVFGQAGAANEVETTRYPVISTSWQGSGLDASVSQLGNLAGHNIGANTLQKVMAGDKVSSSVQYYYQAATGGNNPNIISTVLTSLGQAILGGGIASDLVKGSVAPIHNQLNSASGFLSAVRPATDGSNTPKAYLTMLFFDERFNFIEAADGGVVQQQVESSVGVDGKSLGWGNIKAPKNGYVYVYVSNESDQDVYFDNLKVGITRGNIIEENHYYAYGLKIAAISSQKPGHINEGILKNEKQFQGLFSNMDDDIGWNDFSLRNYDPQTGRWVQTDPYHEFASPYVGMGCDPVNNVDPSGGAILSGLSLGARLAVTGITGAFVGSIAGLASGDADWKDAGIGAAMGLLYGLGNWGQVGASLAMKSVNQLAAVLNISAKTGQVGNGSSSMQIGIAFSKLGTPDQDGDGNGGGGGQGKQTLPEMIDQPPRHPDYKPPKSGAQKVKNPNGKGTGWLDKKGRVWVPTDHNGTHAPHWDVQDPKGGGYDDIYPIVGKAVVKAGLGTVILIGIWEGVKWGIAIFGTPETGGASLSILALP